jgi:hypothetical protein
MAMLIWVPGCAIACWWQVTVALSGDALGYLYSVEWPVFGLFGIVAWWRLTHDDTETIRARSQPVIIDDTPPRRREDEDDELATYNDFLAQLAVKDQRKTWRRS